MHSNNNLISVITPCYNYGKFLPECLDSLIEQSYNNWECIIVNDGSTDNTEEVALKYVEFDSRFKYIYQKNSGLPAARNTALKIAKGNFFQLLDADDLLEINKFENQIKLFQHNQHIDLIYSSMLIFYNDKANKVHEPFVVATNPVYAVGKNQSIINLLLKDVFFLPGCAMFTRKLFTDVGLFNEELYGMEDWNYWFRAALLGFEFYHDSTKSSCLVVRDHSTNMSKAYFKMLNARIIARKNIIEISKKLFEYKKLELEKVYYTHMISAHKVYLYKDLYEYDFHNGSKVAAIKNLLKYAFQSQNYFYPIIKIIGSMKSRFN